MTLNQTEGLIIKNYSGFYYIQDEAQNIFECRVRGKVKENLLSGDRVMFTPLENGKGILEKLLQRENELKRPRVANVTRVLIVMACDQPKPDLLLLDRLIFMALFNGITPCIVFNKCDLDVGESAHNLARYYACKFTVIETSARQNIGIDSLSNTIAGEIAVLAGPSGTGKSSLLKLLTGRQEVRTGEVSKKIGRGKHTTRHVELYPLPGGGWVVDTPGFNVLEVPALKREELVKYYPDFTPYAGDCKFGDCLHYRESECGVRTAVEEKKILLSRYHNYLTILEEIIAKEKCY